MSPLHPVSIGERRLVYLASPERYALRFALELNSEALSHWPSARAASHLDEATEVLAAVIREQGLDMRLVFALAGVLNNRSQIRVAVGTDYSEGLIRADEAGARSEALVREALESHPDSESGHDSLWVNRLKALLAETLLIHARTLCDLGDLTRAREGIAQADLLVRKLGEATADRDCALPKYLVRHLRRIQKDAVRVADGRGAKFVSSIWYQPPTSAA